jgi:hypothetical protein
MQLILAHILHSFRRLRSFRQWDKGMDINAEDDTFYTTQLEEAFLQYVGNVYCTKHQCLPVTKSENVPPNNLVSSIIV